MEAGDASGQLDVGAGGLDGNIPLIASDVPVELVVFVGKADGVDDAVAEKDFLCGILRAGNPDFEFGVVALCASFDFERIAVLVGGGDAASISL